MFYLLLLKMAPLTGFVWLLVAVAGAPTEGPELPPPRQGRIVGGADTHISKVPYQLALESNGHQFCAAAIIGPEFAVSASHCLHGFDPDEVLVRTGSTDREVGGKLIPVKKIFVNPKYKRTKVDYDVAVIQLATPIAFDSDSQPIALTDDEPGPGQKALISGWGALQERGDAPLHLQSLQVSVVDRDACRDSYRNVGEITQRMICAGAPGYDSCKGDSGGPIALGPALVGVVSWGRGCGRQGFPGVYTNIADPEIRAFLRNVTGL